MEMPGFGLSGLVVLSHRSRVAAAAVPHWVLFPTVNAERGVLAALSGVLLRAAAAGGVAAPTPFGAVSRSPAVPTLLDGGHPRGHLHLAVAAEDRLRQLGPGEINPDGGVGSHLGQVAACQSLDHDGPLGFELF